jgi:hypothetical protein
MSFRFEMSNIFECRKFMPDSWFKDDIIIEEEWWVDLELHVKFYKRCETLCKTIYTVISIQTNCKSKFPYNYRVISNRHIYDQSFSSVEKDKGFKSIFSFWKKLDSKDKYEAL